MKSIFSTGRRALTAFVAVMALLLMGGQAFAQGVIRGKVLDSNGEAIIGAGIIIPGTTNGTVTDLDGNFELRVSPGTVLEISCVGYVTQRVAASNSMAVTLEDDKLLLEEAVAVGYGTMRKSDVTGAMVSVKSEELVQNPVLNAVEALQGKAAGVLVSNNGRPGSAGSITVRGRNSTSSGSPLIVIDGVVAQSVGLDMINPQDIESIDVLKDASATAIYGARGGDGVILVTTNRGKSGKLSLNYTGTFTAEKIFEVVPYMDAAQTLEWRRWARYYAGLTDIPGNQPNIDVDYAGINIKGVNQSAWANILKGWGLTLDQWNAGMKSTTWDPSKIESTDWTKFSDRVGITQEHTLSASGGTDKMKAYVSLGYMNNKGTTIGQEYNRYTFRTSVDVTPIEWFSMGGAINARFGNQEYGVDGSGGASNSVPGSLRAKAQALFPYAVPYDKDGNIELYPDGNQLNTTIVGEVGKTELNNLSYDFSGSFYTNFDFGKMWKPLEGLSFRTTFGPQLRFNQAYKYMSANSANRQQKGTDLVTSNASKNFSWTLDNILSYNRKFGAHSINLTLLQEAWYRMNTTLYSMSGYGIALAAVGLEMTQKWWGLGNGTYTRDGEPSFNSLSETQMASYMGRINYSWNDRYMATVSYRYDGASQLGNGHKWAGFPSIALGWRIDKEPWMHVDWIDQLKLRAGWGRTGNYNVGAYSSKDLLSRSTTTFGDTAYTVYYTPTTFANQSIGWETTDAINVGLDFSVLKGRISGVFDVYKNFTHGMIFGVTLPSASGFTNTTDNLGQINNRGFDLTLNTVNINNRDFSWRSTINFDYNKNECVELQNGKEDMVASGLFIGYPTNVSYTYESLGLWTDSPADLAEIAKFNANGHNFAPGMTRIKDQPDADGNTDYKIDANHDRKIMGTSSPLFTLGFNNNIRWKNFTLEIFMYGRFDYFTQTGAGQNTATPSRVIDYYTDLHKNSKYGRPSFNIESSEDSYAGNLIQIKHAGWLKVRQISLGYILPQNFVRRLGLSSIRATAQLKNPFSIYDAAFWTDSDAGQSVNRGLVFGLNIGF
ncbi:MAG: SusC/RagA family TonB-linked outer membrane protein [Bacteroidales bacterium]|nr:SusC/RagA family TonB-linked outer membrane protein [Bacteroidales bacterium]